MSSLLRVQGRIGQRTLLLTTAAVPLTGWAVHAVTLHRQLAATRRDPLTGLLRRDAYTARARRILARHGDSTTVVMVDADHVDRTTAGQVGVSDDALGWRPVRDIQPIGG
ncbi:hypothetical protein AB0C83_40410, partial [Streptomyces sp. NPDC048663]